MTTPLLTALTTSDTAGRSDGLASRAAGGLHPRVRASVALGGALVMVGAWLPWVTMFGGLHGISGLQGLYGRLLLAGGAVAVMLGAASGRGRPGVALRLAAGLGAAMLGLACWSFANLLTLVRAQGADPMVLAGHGPGLPVALAGALLVAVVPLAVRTR